MTKMYTIFKTNRGVSPAVQERAKQLRSKGYRELILSTSQPRLQYRNVCIHLQDPLYEDFFEKARTVFARNRTRVENPCAGSTEQKTVALRKEVEPDYVVSKSETAEQTVIEGSENTQEEVNEEVEPLVVDSSLEFEAIARPRKSKNAPIYFYQASDLGLDLIESILTTSENTENPLWLEGEKLTVNNLPAKYEDRCKLIVGDEQVDLNDVRAVVTDDLTVALLAIESGTPVYLANAPTELEGFVETDVDGLVDASVPSTSKRAKLLEELPRA
jgi:hypothetical protein